MKRILSIVTCLMLMVTTMVIVTDNGVYAAAKKPAKTYTYTKCFSRTEGQKKGGCYFTIKAKVQWKVKNNKVISVKVLDKSVSQSYKSKMISTFSRIQRNKCYTKNGKGYVQLSWGYRAGASSSGGFQEYWIVDIVVLPKGKYKCDISKIYAGAYPNYRWGNPKNVNKYVYYGKYAW